jgi:hypothetical protein
MAAMKDIGIPHDKVNVNGGAVRARPSDRRHRRPHHHDLIYALKKRGTEEGGRRALHRRR